MIHARKNAKNTVFAQPGNANSSPSVKQTENTSSGVFFVATKMMYNKVMLNDLKKALTSKEEFKAFLKKYSEVITYLFFGAMTTLINLVSFWTLSTVFHLETITATVIAWVIAVIFAFVTNKIWVFKSKSKNTQETTKEAVTFMIVRLVTLGVEVFLMWLMVDNFKQDKLIWKLLCSVVTTVLNYIFSKLIVFKEKKTK